MTENARTVADLMEEQRHASAKYWKTVFVAVAVVVAILAAAFLVLWFVVVPDLRNDGSTARGEASAARTDAAAAAGDAEKARIAAEEANKRLQAAGKPTVPVPSPTATASPERPVLSDDDLRAIVTPVVAAEVRAAKVSLTNAEVAQIARLAAPLVPRPADGKAPTAAELRGYASAALAAFCAGGRCDGRTGTAGPVGPAGPQGERGLPGDDAPAVTDEQLRPLINAAMTACIDSGACRGPVGPPGPLCPDGSAPQKQRVVTSEFPVGVWVQLCVLADQNP